MKAFIAIGYVLPSWTWVLVGGLFLTTGDLALKQWLNTGYSSVLFAIGFACYCAGLLCLCLSFLGQNIAIASMALVVINIITLTLATALIFKEPVSAIGYGGLTLAFVSLIILEFYA